MAVVAAILPVAVPATSFSPRSSRIASLSSSSSLLCCQRLSICSATSHLSSGRWAVVWPLQRGRSAVVSCTPSSATKGDFRSPTKLFVSGLSFRTTEESLRNAFQNFGELVEVNLVMDRIANRPRGFAFLRYATEEESKRAIEGMHGKFLDGRVIFVEVSKPKSELKQGSKPASRPFY